MGEDRAVGPTFAALTLTDDQQREMLSLLDFADDLVRWASVSMPDVERYNRSSSAVWALVWWIAGEPAKAATCMTVFRRHGGALAKEACRRDLSDAVPSGMRDGQGEVGRG